MAVPKKKTSKAAAKTRYSAYATKQQKKLSDKVKLVDCPQCKAKKLAHHACLECGTYRGRQVITFEKETKKVTTIKA